MRLALLTMVACGSAPVVAPRILPPNTETACAKAVECEVILPEQMDACVNCLETVADKWNAEAKAFCGDQCPPIKDIDCALVTQVAHDTHLSQCVAARWYGP